MRNSVDWVDDHIEIIDQTRLPDDLVVRELRSVDDVVRAIAELAVRGAPAIGVCGAFGVVLGLDRGAALSDVASRIASARPTAVNLSWAVERVVAAAAAAPEDREAREHALAEALRIRDEDRESCARIGEFGRQELVSATRVMTHCNTGRLATAGIGTALGIVYAKAGAGEPIEVVATETRPLMQGARLTAWELMDAGIPVTVVTDSAAGPALAAGRADAVVVGCDRVARNGDVANKIGTYAIAVLARANGVPFYVAGPMSSFDPVLADGASILIEERGADELDAGDGVDVWNPAFDITPAELVTAFITDVGVLRPPYLSSIASALP
jgi:methylthioribose-1-phosphate isomerase